MLRSTVAATLTAAVLLAPTAQADTGHTGVGRSGKGQQHGGVSAPPAPKPEWVKHILEQIFGTQH